MTCLLLIVAVACGLFTGCATQKPSRTVRVAVLNGKIDYEVNEKGETRDEGWWFGARDRFLSPNPGTQLGEVLSRELAKKPGVEVYSRDDLAIYMSQKERLLKRNFPDLTSFQRKQVLAKQDPVDFGKSLNVDYIVTSDIIKSSTVTNRTFSWWYSTVDCVITVYDVSSGQLVWSHAWEDTDAFKSEMAMLEECARETAGQMARKDVFRLR